ncbi:MAG: DegV family protein [Lachnospiraceae bacterium]|nr:DegV family protein [Lachnospiraceae bacterium]MDD6192336.1 DegV family protein [Lachnospiraceae bacterium]MDY4793934.1 DegV family protein [Pararoseburia sp.]
MRKVAILTDSNSGITQEEAKANGLYVLPTPVYIDDEVFYEGVDLTTETFFKRQAEGADIKTSMPVMGDVIDRWEELLKEYDEVVYIPLSSGLSGSYNAALMLADDYDGKVQVVNNQRISVTMKISVYEAKKMADAGKSAAEIREILERTRFESTIYIMVDTLEYLKKGGRITPAVAAIGSLLKIKPVLQIRGEKLDSFAKARTIKQGKQIMLDAIAKDMTEGWNDPEGEHTIIAMAHTQNQEEIEKFKEEAQQRWPNHDIMIDPLSLVVSGHIGPGALAITCTKKIEL